MKLRKNYHAHEKKLNRKWSGTGASRTFDASTERRDVDSSTRILVQIRISRGSSISNGYKI